MAKGGIGSYIPNVNTTVKVAVVLVIISVLMKVLPIPENYKALFRV